jgi:hypothetical protein
MRHFSIALAVILVGAVAGCVSPAPAPSEHLAGCAHTHELPPLELTAEHERLLAAASAKPRTALDYYLLLPSSYFKIMPDSRERRVTYIDAKTLSNDYLKASRWFECDGGGFEVTIKLYRTPKQTFVLLKQSQLETIFDDGKPREGEPSIRIERPSLWRYSDSGWVQQPDSAVPKISAERVLAKYHRDWDADRKNTDQEKYIWIDYVLSPTTPDVVLMGRENFQSGAYEYGRLKWRGTRFTLR